jgi:hypothetical protein
MRRFRLGLSEQVADLDRAPEGADLILEAENMLGANLLREVVQFKGSTLRSFVGAL